jgi:glycine/D-amino acid oxidase-like deaminating enzyme
VQAWNTTAAVRYPRLARSLDVEVAIVGAGITGLTLALQLVRAGRSVAVLDQQTVGYGATGDSTGHLTACLDGSYQQLRGQFGEGGARLAAQSSMAAIDFIERTVTELAISCDFVRVPGFHFCQDSATAEQLEHEAGLTQSLGLAISFDSKTPLPLPVKGALRFADQAQFDAPRYCQGLALELAGAVYGDTRVESVTDGEPCALCAAGHIVTAHTLVMATHVPKWGAPALLEKLTGQVSYTRAFELRVGGFPDGLFWDTEDPYHYIRRVRDQGRDLLLIGGADQPMHGATASEARFRQLEAYARRHFELGEVAYRGSGEYFDAVDNVPYIGRLPGASHMLVGTGYAGTGLTFGTVAGLLLADLVLGHVNDCEDLYRPSRPAPAPVARAASARQVRR